MKTTLYGLILALAALLLQACSSAGFAPDTSCEIITPGVNADTRVRTWDANGNPHERKVQKDPAFLYDSEVEARNKNN